MDTYGDRLQAAMTSAKRDRAWLAKKLGISSQAVGQVLSGKTRALTAENHEVAVAELKCSGYWLATGKGEMTDEAGVASAAPTEKPLTETLAALAQVIADSDDLTRDQLKPLFARLFEEPKRSPEIIKRIALTLDSSEPRSSNKVGNLDKPDFLKK